MHDIERRALIKGAAMGALAFTVGGGEVLLTPRAARSQGVPLRTLTVAQAATLDALGETLVPGARQAGISQFVDQQISIPAEEALLEARVLNVRPPYANFYRAALGAVERASQALNGQPFADLSQAEQRSLVDNMRRNNRWLARSAWIIRLSGIAQRCRRCRVRNHGRLYRARHSLHASHRADQKVVRWQTKKSMLSSSAPARRVRSLPRC